MLSEFFVTLPKVTHLKLEAQYEEGRHFEDTDDVDWLHLLQQFSIVKTLHVSLELADQIALALEDIAEDIVAEVFPSLDLICLVGQPASSTSLDAGSPVALYSLSIQKWIFFERLKFYVRQ